MGTAIQMGIWDLFVVMLRTHMRSVGLWLLCMMIVIETTVLLPVPILAFATEWPDAPINWVCTSLVLTGALLALIAAYWAFVVALICAVSMAYRACRRARFEEYRVDVSARGFLAETAGTRVFMPWSAVRLVRQYGGSLLIVDDANEFFIVPKRSLPDDGSWTEFCQEIMAFWDQTEKPAIRHMAALLKRRPVMYAVGLALPVLAILVAVAFVTGPSSADIRVDTGDLRYRYFGIPLVYRRMPEPQRSYLLALAAQSEVLVPEWYCCADYTLGSSHDPAYWCRSNYFHLTPWTVEDERLALCIAEDVTRPIVAGCPASMPKCSPLLYCLTEYDVQGRASIRPDWRDSVFVVDYMKMKGIRPALRPTSRSGEPPLTARP